MSFKRLPVRRCARFELLDRREMLAADLVAANVLVLYNAASAAGTQIANYYAQVHPGVHLLAISGVDPNNENITADAYLSTIRPQVLAALTPSIDVIVTTKGLPLRIQVTEAEPTAIWPLLPTYVDPSGIVHQIITWQPYSSLESELTNINTVSTWQMMGDQSIDALPGGQINANPYFRATGAFTSSAYGGMYLTARLDGYTVSDVEGAIDRAQQAWIEPNNTPQGPIGFLVDNDPSITYSPTMANLVNNVLVPDGLPVTYDDTSAFVGTAPGPIIGYDSQGVHQASTPANYLTNGLNVTLANGAIFNSWESYNAYSFTPGGYSGYQGQVAQWLAIGGTAGVGNVQEPGASPSTMANEDAMFQMMLAGKTWGEAAWSAFAQLGFVNTVIGDPLMVWNRGTPGSASIVGTDLFYHNSSRWDVSNAKMPGNSDDNAIAVDKSAYVPGSGAASFANVSSYSLGINGIMIDVAGAHGTFTANDFIFRVGNNNSPSTWATAPAPSTILVRAGAGVNGSDRVELIWNDGAIANEWLEVIARGNDALGGNDLNTGLTASQTFFWGSAEGDTGQGDSSGGFVTDTVDELLVRQNPATMLNGITITNAYDFNRDGKVDSNDQLIARSNSNILLTATKVINLGLTGALAPLADSAATPATDSDAEDAAIAVAVALGGASPTSSTMGGSPAGPWQPSSAAATSDAALTQIIEELERTEDTLFRALLNIRHID